MKSDALKLEIGKRYVTRDGEVTGPLVALCFPFHDPISGNTYTTGGKFFAHDEESKHDLVSEYVEPTVVSLDKKYRTRAGDDVILTTLKGGRDYPVLGVVWSRRNNCYLQHVWMLDGSSNSESTGNDPFDLVEVVEAAPEPKSIRVTRWVNVYDGPGEEVSTGDTFETKLRADANTDVEHRFACVEVVIEAKEGDGL